MALLYAQFSHALSLNDVCDSLRLWRTPLRALRGATPPPRNTLSHANKIRSSAMAEELFWQVLKHLQSSFPRFGNGQARGLAWRFRRTIHVVDATVIQLLATCLDWAEHNHRKAAARCHVRLSLRSLLPGFVVLFMALAILQSAGALPGSLTAAAGEVSQACLMMGVAALGMKTSFATLARAGWRLPALMAVTTAWIAAFVLAAALRP